MILHYAYYVSPCSFSIPLNLFFFFNFIPCPGKSRCSCSTCRLADRGSLGSLASIFGLWIPLPRPSKASQRQSPLAALFSFPFPGIIKTTPAIFIIYFIAQTIGTMTTPTASAVVSLESAELPRNNAARSAGQISSTSISDRGTRSGGPVDLDETQQTIDSETVETVETNTLTCNPSARDDGAHVQEQNAGSVQDAGAPSGTDVVMQNLLDDMVRAHTLISLVCS